MDCPVCQRALKEIRYEDEKIDACPRCGGIWFDTGELQVIADSLISKNKVDYQTIKEAHRSKKAIFRENEIRICPRCKISMQPFNYFSDSNIFLDKCDSCKSIWADRGEIRAIAKYLKGNPEMAKLARAVSHADWKCPFIISKTAKCVALAIAGFYLIVTYLSGPNAFIEMMRYLIVPLACIFFGEEMGYIIGVRFRLSFFTPVVTKESPGILVSFMGWVVLLLPIIEFIILIILL